MIVLRITSGLGNQMFQYAFYTYLKNKYKDTEILADTFWFNNNHEGREYELEAVFSSLKGSRFEIKKAGLLQVISLSGKIPNLFRGGFGKTFEKIRRYPNRILKDTLLKKRTPFIYDQLDGKLSNEYEETPDGLINPFFDKITNLDVENDYYICGFFIEERFYGPVIEEVKEKLVFPDITEDKNVGYAEEIRHCDSVSIHVRRGDYLSDLYKESFITLGRDYYERAVSYVMGEIEKRCKAEGRESDIKFFIFSDDEKFVKEQFDWIENKVIVTGNCGSKSYRDMQLMSLCKHNIIANSTFSQWGALLNNNENHIVVYPKVYMREKDNEEKTTPGWVRL